MPQFRHEVKHRLNYCDMLTLQQRLKHIMQPDSHAKDGTYFIRSLYFDDFQDTALHEKLDGINQREKFRIRYYDFDSSLIHLEKKSKCNSLGTKQSAILCPWQAQAIADGDLDWMQTNSQPLVTELYAKMKINRLKPKTIVDYTRQAFVYRPGNVRVTLDHNIRTGLCCTDFLREDCITVPVPDDPIILEVKWDNFLPEIIQDAIQLNNTSASAFSKYAACRMYD